MGQLIKKYKIFCALALVVCFATPAEARWKYRISPLAKLNFLYYPKGLANTKNTRFNIRGELNGSYRWKRWFKVVLQPVFEFDATAEASKTGVSPVSATFDPSLPNRLNNLPAVDENDEKTFFDLREAYAQFRFRPFSVSVGNMIYSWGVNDGFSPIDVINARRFVSPLNSEKLGAASLNFRWIGGDFDAEFVYIPIQRPSILPGEDSRWLPREVYITRGIEDVRIVLPDDLRYNYRDYQELDNALDSNFAMRFRGQVERLDFSVMYFEGFSPAPSVNLFITASTGFTADPDGKRSLIVDKDLALIPYYFKCRVYGGSLVYSLDEWIFRFETAITQQISTSTINALPGDIKEHVLSVEHDINIASEIITVQIQGTLSDYETDAENGTISLGRIFEGAVIGGLRWAPNEKFSFIVTGLWDTKRRGTVYVLNSDYKIIDSLTASASFTSINGGTETPLGTYKNNDLLGLSVRYDF